MNVVTIKINGIEYNLKGEEQEEYLHKVAGYVDKKVKNILGNNTKLSSSSAAILSAVNVVDEMFKVQRQNETMCEDLKHMEEQRKLYEDQILSLKKQLTHMEEYNAELQLKVKNSMTREEIVKKDEIIEKLQVEMNIIQEATQKYMRENNRLRADNKEMKFQLQSAKYKTMDLQHKLIENQIDLVKEKKKKYPLINNNV